MTKKYLEAQPKTSAKIWAPINEKLKLRMEAGCLRRDAYLAKVLEVELEHLDQEVPIPNSEASFAFVTQQLEELGDRKLVSLALPQSLIDRLNTVCARKRIVRDAFLNRLCLLLVADPKVISRLLFDGDDWEKEVWSEHRNDGPFYQNSFYPLRPDIDPLWAMRAGLYIAARAEGIETVTDAESGVTYPAKRDLTGDPVPVDSLYTVVFDQFLAGKTLLGFSTYLPDARIPNTPKARAHKAKLDDLLSQLLEI